MSNVPVPQGPQAPPAGAPADTSHVRMAAWLAVAAVAVSSGAVSFSASAQSTKAPTRVDPNMAIMRELVGLRESGKRLEAGLGRLERGLNDLKDRMAPRPKGEDDMMQGDMPRGPAGQEMGDTDRAMQDKDDMMKREEEMRRKKEEAMQHEKERMIQMQQGRGNRSGAPTEGAVQ